MDGRDVAMVEGFGRRREKGDMRVMDTMASFSFLLSFNE